MNDHLTLEAPDVATLRTAAYDLLRRDPDHRDAHLRLYELEQMTGAPAAAVAHLRAALRSSPVVDAAHGPPGRLRVTAIVRIAGWDANVPLELVIDESRIALTRFFIDGSESVASLVAMVPAHDVLFNAIAESDDARSALHLVAQLATALGEPCVNDPAVVAHLGRDAVAHRFADSTTVLAPPVRRVGSASLAEEVVGEPIVVRPVGSQAGIGLARITSTHELQAYLGRTPSDAYFVMPFIAYDSDDGHYRKYRVIFVDGVAYACHLAISPHWMIHYYNAPMAENAWMRDEEAAFIADLTTVFHGALADALREVAAAVPLAYFGIDCARTQDGRLLLFEADAAMLVHGTDPSDLYPYKAAGFNRVKTALTTMLERGLRADGEPARNAPHPSTSSG